MASDLFHPPRPLMFDGNVSENFRRWKQRYEIYMSATEKIEKPKSQQASILLHLLGEEGIEIFNTLDLSSTDRQDPDKILEAFQNYCEPRKNVVYERYKFFTRNQKEGEPVDHFITDLKKLSLNCEFGELKDGLIRDRLVCGTTSTSLKQRMLRETDLNLERAVAAAQAEEQTKQQLRTMEPESKQSVHAVHRRHIKGKGKTDSNKGATTQTIYKCSRCGKDHKIRECPAFGKTCSRCQKTNHFAHCCRQQNNSNHRKHKSVHAVQDDNDSSDDDDAWIGTLRNSDGPTSWSVKVKINNEQSVTMKIDTGAEADVITEVQWSQLKNVPNLQPCKSKLKNFDNADIQCKGTANVHLSVGKRRTRTTVYISANDGVSVLGLQSSLALGLVKPGENSNTVKISAITTEILTEKYKDVFTGLGRYPEKYHITLADETDPIISHPRRVPPMLHKQLKEKLDSMVKDGVITLVDQPTKWVHNLVVVKKANGSLRICLDPRNLNEHIERELFEIPTFEQITANLGGKKFFTILDQKESYWQVELDDDSSLLTTFNTPFGRYRFMRMPFGISSASEVLQKRVFQTFGDIDGVNCLSDDMLIAAKTESEHDEILEKVMKRARDVGVKFNPNKVQLKKTKVKYMGRIISEDGIAPDPSKVKAIVDMPLPKDVKGVQRLLGMINFISPFIQNMSKLTAPLRELLKKDAQWTWLPEHTEAVKKIKSVVSKLPTLKIFDSKNETIIQCDASSTGLGACLLQQDKPVAFASRSLTETEKTYAQIEKELLAIVFAAEHFHQYIYGQSVNVQSDHKPLETILRKPLCKASPRLQLMMLRLLRYNLHVKYTPGSKLVIADTLSRAYTLNATEKPKEFEEDNLRIHSTTCTMPASSRKLEQIRQETRDDPVLSRVMQNVKNDNWTKTSKHDEKELEQLKAIRNSIYEENGILYTDGRMIIPRVLREETLNNLHQGHLGTEKAKRRARQSIFWPNLNAAIEEKVRKCDTCQKFQNRNRKEPLISHEIPKKPWTKLGADIFEFEGNDYLIVVDYFSKYPEVAQLNRKSTGSVIRAMKPILARHGIPEELIADNNPFASYEMHQFAKEWNFTITTSSPRYPQSNGQVERFVNIIKRILIKCKNNGTDPNLGILMYRNTPISGTSYSPAQLLMGRQLKDLIPEPMNKNTQKYAAAHKELVNEQAKAKAHFDKNAYVKVPHRIGDSVRVDKGKGFWEKAIVVKHAETPRSYFVTTEDGNTVRRNSKMLRPSYHQPIIDPEVETESSLQKSGRVSDSPRPQAEFSHSPTKGRNVYEHTADRGNTKFSQEHSHSPVKPQYITRSGRSVRVPSKYQC